MIKSTEITRNFHMMEQAFCFVFVVESIITSSRAKLKIILSFSFDIFRYVFLRKKFLFFKALVNRPLNIFSGLYDKYSVFTLSYSFLWKMTLRSPVNVITEHPFCQHHDMDVLLRDAANMMIFDDCLADSSDSAFYFA